MTPADGVDAHEAYRRFLSGASQVHLVPDELALFVGVYFAGRAAETFTWDAPVEVDGKRAILIKHRYGSARAG